MWKKLAKIEVSENQTLRGGAIFALIVAVNTPYPVAVGISCCGCVFVGFGLGLILFATIVFMKNAGNSTQTPPGKTAWDNSALQDPINPGIGEIEADANREESECLN